MTESGSDLAAPAKAETEAPDGATEHAATDTAQRRNEANTAADTVAHTAEDRAEDTAQSAAGVAPGRGLARSPAAASRTEEDGSAHGQQEAVASRAGRHPVLKTYKLYIGGKFPRTESGRYERLTDATGATLANFCRASRKDFRDAVVAARAAQPGWTGASAYNRGQVIYRAAEMLEGRREQFVSELVLEGVQAAAAEAEVSASVDRLIHYAGWCDKVQQVFSAVNPVASSHFNFSILEPTGVVAALAPPSPGLLGLVSVLAPILVPGNSAVVLASAGHPLTAITLAEVLHSSDVPGGVVNLLTGRRDELLPHMASHLDVNAVVLCDGDATERELTQGEAVHNLKRVVLRDRVDWSSEEAQDPYSIVETCEIKTTWHPIGS
ncbi:MAG TPA: aldehyde dehydrogenase family protein [Thermoanaerobaculia bacterium]|nr:aldehyde dehydrogenase family protein [Thermoanaerobaculia bacterium]